MYKKLYFNLLTDLIKERDAEITVNSKYSSKAEFLGGIIDTMTLNLAKEELNSENKET